MISKLCCQVNPYLKCEHCGKLWCETCARARYQHIDQLEKVHQVDTPCHKEASRDQKTPLWCNSDGHYAHPVDRVGTISGGDDN